MVADGQGGNERVEGVVGCRVEEPLMPKPLLASCGKILLRVLQAKVW